jgi:hypothetical protein
MYITLAHTKDPQKGGSLKRILRLQQGTQKLEPWAIIITEKPKVEKVKKVKKVKSWRL